MGLHPWKIAPFHWENDLSSLLHSCNSPSVVAIGECGLDKMIVTELELQKAVFRKQIQLAASLQKPLIIHCVRAWEEVFSLLKQENFTRPVLFHGFNKSTELAQTLIDKGYYLSFGSTLKIPAKQALLREIPIERILLETDDAPISIEEVYDYAAKALQIDMNSLSLQLQKNAGAVFGALD